MSSKVPGDVGQVLGEVAPERILGRAAAREFVDALMHGVAELRVVVGGARESDDPVVRRQDVLEAQVPHRRHQHPLDEIAGRAEEDDRARVGDAVGREPLAQRVRGDGAARLCGGGHSALIAWPPN